MSFKSICTKAILACTCVAVLCSSVALADVNKPIKGINRPTPVKPPSKRDPKQFVITPGQGKHTDIAQGNAGTCWILASMAALEANGDPLDAQIHSLGNNYYQVYLYNFADPAHRPAGGLKSDVEKVFFDGTTTPADPAFDPKNPHAAWVVITQRAVVQAISHWDPSESVANPHSGGAGDALSVLGGRSVQTLSVQGASTQQTVQAALAAHKPIVLGTSGSATTLVAGHCYAVVGSANQGLILYNPWGSSSTVPWSTINQDGSTFFIRN
jgi:hypothetical protein